MYTHLSPALLIALVLIILSCSSEAISGIEDFDAKEPADPVPEEPPPSDQEMALWELEEWTLSNPSYDGNPFDVEARVAFHHQDSDAVHTTEMFYDGDETWAFRFTPTKTGTWTYSTSSEDPDLDGHSGTISVLQNPDPEAHGFVTKSSVDPKKWAWQKGNDGEEEAFVPQFVMVGANEGTTPREIDSEAEVDALISAFMDRHGFTGFHVAVLAGYWFDKDGSRQVPSGDANPDPATFEALELFIQRVHAAGGMVHIWTWGDGERTQSAADLQEGVGGAVETRLNRYIAARLGPMPGWTMGYGFDLYEWTSEQEVHAWHDAMMERLGWKHLLGARPQEPKAQKNYDYNNIKSWNEGFGYTSAETHRPDYITYRELIALVDVQPAFEEDRFRTRQDPPRSKDYNEEETRRGLYHSTMAGGVANIWGRLNTSDKVGNTGAYSNADELKTYSTFFFDKSRFRPDMQPDGTISNGYALVGANAEHYIIYAEGSSSIQIDLSSMNGVQPAVVVDAKKPYEEIDLGTLDPVSQVIALPNSSDWVIAIGNY